MLTLIKQEHRFVIVLFILSFMIRGLVFQLYLNKNHNYWQIDSPAYHELAVSISQGKGIVYEDGRANFYRLPGYPVFLSFFYKLFGANYRDNDTNGVTIALWAQVLIASVIPILIFLLSITLFSNLLLAKVASMWSAFHIGFVLYSGFFMTETLFIFCYLLFLIIFLSIIHLFFCSIRDINNTSAFAYIDHDPYLGFCPEPGCESIYFQEFLSRFSGVKLKVVKPIFMPSYKLFLAGIILGVSGLIRPVGHYLLVLALIIIICSGFNRFKNALTLFFGWLLPSSLWLLRNYAMLGHCFFHTLPGGHFLYLSASRVAMHTQNVSYWEARDNLTDELKKLEEEQRELLGRNPNEIEKCKLAEGLAVKYFKSSPIISIKNWMTDFLRTSLSLYSAELLYLDAGREKVDYFNKDRTVSSMFQRYIFPQTENTFLKIIVFLEIAMYFIILLGIALAFINLFRQDSFVICSWTRSSLFILIFLVLSIAGGYARMRLPIEPFLIILSMSYWVNVKK